MLTAILSRKNSGEDASGGLTEMAIRPPIRLRNRQRVHDGIPSKLIHAKAEPHEKQHPDDQAAVSCLLLAIRDADEANDHDRRH